MAKKTLVNPTATQPETATAVVPAPGNTVALTPTSAQTPYVVFANKKSEKYDDFRAADATVKEGDPILVRPEPLQPVKLDPLQFILVAGEHLWIMAEKAPPWSALQVSLTEQRGADWCETYEALLLVRTGAKWTPARVSARRAQCNGFKTAAAMLSGNPPLVMTDEWLTRSDAHKATAKIDMLAARFVSTGRLTSATGKSGMPWHGCKSSQSPLTQEEADQVVAATKTPAFEATAASYQKRVDELKALVK